MQKRTSKILKQATLGMMAIVRNESYFVHEWLYFHRFAGVEKFYLWVEDDVTIAQIKKTPFAEDVIVYKGHVDPGMNPSVYRQMMDDHRHEVRWMILGDVDEFFFNEDGKNLQDIVQSFGKYDCGGIIVPWTQMGLSGFVDRPPLPITDYMVLAQPLQQLQQYKVIVRTDAYVGCDCDWFMNVNKPYRNQDGTECTCYGSILTTVLINSKIRCHHYFARGVDDIFNRYYRYKDDKDYLCKLEYVPYLMRDWTILDTHATLYSSELRKVLVVESADANADNTVFVSMADYEQPEKEVKLLVNSAKENGVDIEWASFGEEWISFVQNKVEKILAYMRTQYEVGKKYAFVIDSADVMFVKSLQEILDSFNRVYTGGVIFNCDYLDMMWPLSDELLRWHISTNYGKNGIVNAGCYCGLITDIIALLEQLLDVRQQIFTKDYRQFCTNVFSASASCGYEMKMYDSSGKLINDDQWLLHIMQCEVNPLLKVDKFKQIFAFIDSYPDKQESVYAKNCTGDAGILHISHILQKKSTKRMGGVDGG
jgi:hypothetical protein